MSFSEFQLTSAPPFLLRPRGAAWCTAMGRAKGGLAEWAKDAAAARMPLLTPDDALSLLAAERAIEAGVSETEAAFRERLRTAHYAWSKGGTRPGMETVIAISFQNALLEAVLTGGFYGTGWNVDAARTLWPRFDVFFNFNPFTIRATGRGRFTGSSLTAPSALYGFSGSPIKPYHLIIEIVNGGVPSYGFVTCRVSTDGGVTWGITSPLADGTWAMDELGSTSAIEIQVAVLDAPLTAGDRWEIIALYAGGTLFALPDDASDEISHLRRLISTWKPGFATCGGIYVSLLGEAWGWPGVTLPSSGDGWEGVNAVETTGVPTEVPATGRVRVTDVISLAFYDTNYQLDPDGVTVVLETATPMSYTAPLQLQLTSGSHLWGDSGVWGGNVVVRYAP